MDGRSRAHPITGRTRRQRTIYLPADDDRLLRQAAELSDPPVAATVLVERIVSRWLHRRRRAMSGPRP